MGGRRGLHLQILRSHHGRSRAHCYPQRSSHPMDLRSQAEASRASWQDRRRQDVARIGSERTLFPSPDTAIKRAGFVLRTVTDIPIAVTIRQAVGRLLYPLFRDFAIRVAFAFIR